MQTKAKEKKIKSYEMDMCNGPLLGKILIFSIPLMLSGMLQLMFNAADMIVVGRYAGSHALAAVGSTSSLTNLLINLFIGLSIGSNVLVAHYYGSGESQQIHETVHTSILLSLLSGIALAFLGFFLATPLLNLMDTPEDVISHSVLYMRIYFLGMPANLLYNFGASILRSFGDTKRPLYFLVIAGIVNVILNLIFVIVLQMGVAGVALATIIAQCISAALVVYTLIKTDGACHLELKKLHIYPDKLIRMVKIGLPAGLQGALFSISNMLIQSSVNSFGSVVMAGNTASSNIENFIYTAMNAFAQTAISFTSQNYGGKRWKRIGKIAFLCILCVTVTGLTLGGFALMFGHHVLGFYSKDTEVIAYGILRMEMIVSFYFLCGIMDVLVGCLRGLGASIIPMIVSLLGACGLRTLWIFTVFQVYRTLPVLYISYPVSWAITGGTHLICFFIIYRKLRSKYDTPQKVSIT